MFHFILSKIVATQCRDRDAAAAARRPLRELGFVRGWAEVKLLDYFNSSLELFILHSNLATKK